MCKNRKLNPQTLRHFEIIGILGTEYYSYWQRKPMGTSNMYSQLFQNEAKSGGSNESCDFRGKTRKHGTNLHRLCGIESIVFE